jgi:hypothetical protein
MRVFIKVATTLLLFCAASGTASRSHASDWEVKSGGGEKGGSCVITSAKKAISDGYQEVTAWFVVDGKTVTLQSDSVLDPSFSDIGLRVGKKEFIKADKVVKERQAVFESEYANLVRLFKAGLAATVQMRFWPTWPSKGPQTTSISLIGFTKAYEEANCGQ